ncbi:unnamed protein product [Prunus armeniaca]|uniref:Uncharacterized protein n=1 Tax=Prunus armeniaca TaxID=36596 RepID=A0A6J5X9L8_PRUAR|nr:unnamed protein product [Prunus armeniaca]CAB4309223.1 unnamed protein product [Prunus armeniaca]
MQDSVSQSVSGFSKAPVVFCPKNKKKKNLSIAGVEKNLPTLSSSLAPTPTDSEEEGSGNDFC